MKSEFTLALNQICSERNLPREIITQVLESALATSYRKNANIMNSQNVAVKVDIESGDMRVFVEKEVVEEVLDDRTEVSTEEAKVEKADSEIGDCIMVDVTMRDFGRIAAQNVKQMIVQKLREAERDFQYNTFAEREGEVVHGMVSNITPAGVVLNLGRAEGILPRKEQIPGERCELQQRLRAYVTEVKRSNRGPQIMLSRAHKNMLRRLLEIEVPEIQKGQVEIKSIAREPGSRSKVAVAALQAGVDPVGACVGQRGTPHPGHRQRIERREDRRHRVERRPGRLHHQVARPGQSAGRASRHGCQELQERHGGGARRSALPGDRPRRAERPPGRQADRLAYRHQERQRGAERGAGQAGRGRTAAAVGRQRHRPDRARAARIAGAPEGGAGFAVTRKSSCWSSAPSTACMVMWRRNRPTPEPEERAARARDERARAARGETCGGAWLPSRAPPTPCRSRSWNCRRASCSTWRRPACCRSAS